MSKSIPIEAFARPLDMANYLLPKFDTTPWHIREFEKEFLKMYDSDTLNRLIINVSVRHGKSFFFSYLIPFWIMMTSPTKRILLLSHSAEMAEHWSLKVRDEIAEWGHLFGIKLDDNQCTKSYWKNNMGGELVACSMLGPLAGRGFDFAILDDIQANQEKVDSPTQTERMKTYLTADVFTRLEPGSKCIVVQSRRARQDVCGFLLSLNPDLDITKKWHQIKYPAIRQINGVDTPLWDKRFNLQQLYAIRDELKAQGKTYVWECLYQNNDYGDPAEHEWMSYILGNEKIWYDELPPGVVKVCHAVSLDPSLGGKDRIGDYSAILYGILGDDMCIYIDTSYMLREPVDKIEDVAIKLCQDKRADGLIVESNGFQQLICDNILKKWQTAPIFSKTSTENKRAKIRMCLTPLFAQGKLRFKKSAMNEIIVNQALDFPNGQYDDGLDAITLLVGIFNKLRGLS